MLMAWQKSLLPFSLSSSLWFFGNGIGKLGTVTFACWHMSSYASSSPLHHIKGVGNGFNHRDIDGATKDRLMLNCG